ncbi:MAG: Uma2 family endonuclease [Bacillota bacterium]|nr:Uma2 family endonuclease [Bacillota bacterium]
MYILSGIPLGTVQKVFSSAVRTPRRKTYIALAKVLDPDEARRLEYSFSSTDGGARVAEKQGEYTIEDYMKLPDDVRVELIDGVIYDMAAPLVVHQLVVSEIVVQLRNCMEEHEEDCIPLPSPVDVQLDKDNKTMVQPDVLILCDKQKIVDGRVFGAPEFVLEVLSKSTRSKDQVLKLQKYMSAGCREYWIVDIDNHRVMVYDFEGDSWPAIYPFAGKVPVGLSEGKCSIDFDKINKQLQKLYP